MLSKQIFFHLLLSCTYNDDSSQFPINYSGVQMIKDWTGCFILMCLSLSQKPGKEGQMDYLTSFYFDFSTVSTVNVFVSDL